MATVTREQTQRRTARPASTIWRDSDAVHLQVEMPGVGKEHVDIQVEDDTLTITGSRSFPEDAAYLVRERRLADFHQTYTLDETIDRDKIDAHMENGVLELTLNLREQVKPRKIEVQAN